MDSHRIYAILLKHLVERHGWRGSVVKTVSTSRMIDKLAALYGLTVHVTPIGFKYICQWMVDEEVLIGGEESGGIGIPKHLKERDGIFSGLLLLEAMALSGKTASGLVREIFDMVGEHYYSREDLHFTREEMPFVQESLKKIKPERIGDTFVQHIETMDGTRFDFENGWLLLRASGTEPVVRVYSESTDQSQPTKWITSGEALIRDAIRNG
jgi:phosphomannomutase